jgi:NAD(P)-dependent dehydrogenase (short-subunit alcohol dehydrogenase family)
MKLESRVAIVTGAASGISRAVAIRFAQEGAAVMAIDSDPAGGMETVRQIRDAGGRAEFARVDVAKSEEVNRAVKDTIERLDGLDILFNGAGILAYGSVVETSEETWSKIMAVNLTGTFLLCKAAVPHMIAKGRGSIINVASTTGAHDAGPRAVAYVTSKGGVTLLTRAMAIDHARQGIRVNAICPGPTDTPMLRKAKTAEELDAFADSFPMGRLGRPEEIAAAAAFLASDDASFMTGSLMFVDGGQTAEV